MNPDYLDILSELSAAGAEFMVVGAYALAIHGLPRATGDIDIWVNPTVDNARRIWSALVRFNAPLQDLAEADLSVDGLIFQIGVAPRRIDIMTSIDGVGFSEAWADRTSTSIGPLVVPVISRSNLMRNKRASGRPKDLADLAWLESSEPS
ncbi:MAG: hypothetical protein SGI90_13925 [Candidatus Eisenbacteria bacterium]|nr:hypothetical protein [Candidatus Eisenbacteria bacterium]